MPDALDTIRTAVLEQLGACPDRIDTGVMQRFAGPDERPGKRSCWLFTFPDLRGAVFGCWRRGVESSWQASSSEQMTPAERRLMREHIAHAKAQREREQRAAWRVNDDRNHALMRATVAVTEGDPVALYLHRRLGLDASRIPAALCMCRRASFVHDDQSLTVHPAMFAPIVDNAGKVLTVHRTFLTDDGHKASVSPVRKLSPAGGIIGGACIRLGEVTDGAIGVAEGVESSLGAWLVSGLPTWAAYSAGNLAAFQWPRSVRRVVVFGDNDPAGLAAAEKLRERVAAARLSVEVCIPEKAGQDWCDVAAEAQGVCQ